MNRITLYDIEDIAHVLELSAIKENKNVEIKTQDSKQPFIFENDDDKRVSNTINDMSDAE